jgi:DNA-binding NarL/FixJ family response regulator
VRDTTSDPTAAGIIRGYEGRCSSPGSAAAESSVNPACAAPPPIRVLLVDDHAIVAESLRRLLESCVDIEVVDVVGTSSDGVTAADRLRPDVVLMDYVLPDSDGVTAAALIMRRNAATRVVILTAASDDERLALRAAEAGCSGFVGKDRGVDELLAAIRAAHLGEALISPSMLARLLPRLDRRYKGVGRDVSRRELEVIKVMAEGASDQEIADRLGISLNTARKHVQNIIRKLGAHSKLEAIVIAVREGVIEPL